MQAVVMHETGNPVEPGAGWDAAHWPTDRRVSLVGADNWAFEVIPFEREEGVFAVHQHPLAETGTHILENSTTAELAADGHSEFLFCLTVQKTKGSTGAMAVAGRHRLRRDRRCPSTTTSRGLTSTTRA